MTTWEADVKPGGTGRPIRVQVQANSAGDARRLLEGQYGKGNVTWGPHRSSNIAR